MSLDTVYAAKLRAHGKLRMTETNPSGWCVKDFDLVSIGCNRMGAHFNPILLIIVNSESIDSIEQSWDTSVLGFYGILK